MTAAEFAERVGARRRGSSWWVRCPVHIEKTASLSIREGDDGRVLLWCFGCNADREDLVEGFGFEMADLFPDGHRRGRPSSFRNRRQELLEYDAETLLKVEDLARQIRKADRDERKLLDDTYFVLEHEAWQQGWGPMPERVAQRRATELEAAKESTRDDGLDHLTPQQCDDFLSWVEDLYDERG